MYKVGERLRVKGYNGTVVEPTNEKFLAKFPDTNLDNFVCVQFDGPGPYDDGIGIFRETSFYIFRIR